MQTQIRCHIAWRLIRIYSVCLLDFPSKIEYTRQNKPDTPKMTNELIQHITVQESTSIQWVCGEPGPVDRVLALHTGSRGFDSHWGHMSEQFFQSNRPGYPHPVSSGIRVAVGNCSVTECPWWRLPYQTGKTVHVHAKHYKHNEDGRTVPYVCGNGSVPLSHPGNVVTRIGIHTHSIQWVKWKLTLKFVLQLQQDFHIKA